MTGASGKPPLIFHPPRGLLTLLQWLGIWLAGGSIVGMSIGHAQGSLDLYGVAVGLITGAIGMTLGLDSRRMLKHPTAVASQSGLTVQSWFYERRTIPWDEIRSITVHTTGGPDAIKSLWISFRTGGGYSLSGQLFDRGSGSLSDIARTLNEYRAAMTQAGD